MSEFTTIEELVAEHECDPTMAEHLRAARRKLAPILYPEGGPRYERMMSGFGPNWCEECGLHPGDKP